MTREEALKIMKARRYLCGGCGMDCSCEECCTAYDMAIEALQEQKWIICSERLPDSNGEYIVTTKDGEVYQDTLQFLCQWDDCGDDVVAWMPLPKPYQEDNQ